MEGFSMFELPEFELPNIDWSKLDFQWLVEDIEMIILMMKIMMVGIPAMFIFIFFGVIFLFLRNINKVSRIEKHMCEIKELLREQQY